MAIYFVVKTTDICAGVMYNIIIAISPIIIERNNIMIRKIIRIDEEKCNGCGACANACHEGAIGMVNGKANVACHAKRKKLSRKTQKIPFKMTFGYILKGIFLSM